MTSATVEQERTTVPHRPRLLDRVAALGRRVGPGRAVLLLGSAVILLHVADDSFVQPPAGTGAGDHVASGLVPLVLIGLAVWRSARWRAGSRAALTMLVGLFGLGVGVAEAGYYTVAVGPSGDDWSGLLCIPVGAAMIISGAVALWRSRRLGDSLRRRYLRRAGRTVAAVVGLYMVAAPTLFGYVVTHVQRAAVPPDALGVAHEDVSFRTSDGLRLQGWYIPSRNGAAVIAFPGRKGPQAHARMLARHSYGVLLFDRRGEGASQGAGNLRGWGGEKDIIAGIDFLQRRSDVDPQRIGGIGFSVGGELMLEAAAKDKRLAAVVSEGAGTRQLREQRQDYSGGQFWSEAVGFAVAEAAVAVFSDTLPPPQLTDLVPRIAPRPVFFIWAPNGGNVETMNPKYHRLAGQRSSIWAIPDASHIAGITARPEEYERRLTDFFDAALRQR